MLEVVNAFESSTGVTLNWKFFPRRKGDIEKIWADSSFSNNILQWKASKSLEEMVQSAWKWENTLKNE